MQNARHILENLLAKGKLEAAIEASLLLCRHYSDQERISTAAQHSARYHALMNDYNAGTLNDDDYRPERARINRAMLDLAHGIPADWTEEALTKVGFDAKAYDHTPGASNQKSFLEKWGLILGIVASLMGILGWTLKDFLFPEKEQTTQTAEPKQPASDAPAKQEPPQIENPKPASAAKTPATKPVTNPSNKTSTPTQEQPQNRPGSLATSDEVFRSFGNAKIVEDMERGYKGKKLAFRNVRTKEILCCYTDAADFSEGKAYVSKDGINYFYINKRGEKVE